MGGMFSWIDLPWIALFGFAAYMFGGELVGVAKALIHRLARGACIPRP